MTRVLLTATAIGGFAILAILYVKVSLAGYFPPHDTVAYYLAGWHLREGSAVYDAPVNAFLAFLYAPTWAVLWAPVSVLPIEIPVFGILIAELFALRYIAGSWRWAGILCWLPFVWADILAGNVNLILAAAILAGIRSERWAGPLVALMSLAKFVPVLSLIEADRRTRIRFLIVLGVLVAITLPWAYLWPEWIGFLLSTPPSSIATPILPRLVIGAGLLALRRPWATAAAAAISTPSLWIAPVGAAMVLFLPAARLIVPDSRLSRIRLSLAQSPA